VAADRLFKISLNPTKENLSYLSTGHEIKSIEFYSLEGKILVTYKKINKTGILPTDQLVAGMYYLHITYDDDFVLVHKFTKL
jgi:hypothetical protein